MGYERVIEEIKSRIDIVEFVSEYLNLKKTGENYKALCPFHSEKTPSFVVSPSKQIFHCFGCGAGGDVFSFLIKHENISFTEAVRLLAERAGVQLKGYSHNTEGQSRRQTLLEIHRLANEFFHRLLWDQKESYNYLTKRGISEETIREFSLGYAPGGGDVLYRYLTKRGFKEEDILASGVCKKGENTIIDTFRDRVVFPIYNMRGDVIAFGGRIIRESTMAPKYLNSPETILFKKSNELYGLYHARKEINKKGYIVFTEGYLDVIACHQAGVKNVVAPLGTALTEQQLRKIKPLCRKVLLLFDSDAAGVKATKRAFSMIYENNMEGKVLLLPEGDDPDSFIRNRGAEEFKKRFGHAQGIVDFFFSTSRSTEVEIIRELIEIVSRVEDGILRARLVKDISEKASLSEIFIREELMKQRKGQFTTDSSFNRSLPATSVDEMLIALLIGYPEYIERVKEQLTPDYIENEMVRNIYMKIIQTEKEDLFAIINEDEKALVSRLLLDISFDEEQLDRNVEDCIKRIRERRLKRRLKELQEEMRIATERSNRELLTGLQKQWTELIKEGQQSGIL